MVTGTRNLRWLDQCRWMIERARVPRLRSMRRFAEEEIIIPDGKYQGLKFRCSTQPYTRLFFDEVDSGRWSRIVVTGPTQSGKTLVAFVIPILWHLFEVGETVVVGLPDMGMAADKWFEDILPVIERSKYRDQLPKRAASARTGTKPAIRFPNGATLRFMSAGGGDKSRAGFTTRVVVITETDGMETSGSTSYEADKITQIIGRTRQRPDEAVVYMECTVTIEEGRTWREIKAGSASRILLLCPHCGAWVALERDQLRGWKEADTANQARRQSAFYCSDCQEPWTDQERIEANYQARILHGTQQIEGKGPAATIVGELPDVNTLGFRWSAVHNLFTDGGLLGADEWTHQRAADADNAEREMCQFVWAIPHHPPHVDLSGVTMTGLIHRQGDLPRGIVPDDCAALVVHVDVGKRFCSYVVVAWRVDASGCICDYGTFDVPSDDLGTSRALLLALRDFKEVCEKGWGLAGGGVRMPNQVWIDARWQGEEPGADVVYQFCREAGGPNPMQARYRPALGLGTGRREGSRYRRPKSVSGAIKRIYEGFHVVYLKPHGLYVLYVNADFWKGWIHERLRGAADGPGALVLFKAPPNSHISFAKQIAAEKQIEEFDPKKGTTTRWVAERRSNHYFDALYNTGAAGYLCGIRMEPPEQRVPRPQAVEREPQLTFRTDDGRPFFVLDR